MKRINLRDIYPFYEEDYFVMVEDAVADTFDEFKRQEQAWERKTYRHRAYYSLDRNDGIENDLPQRPQSPYEAYEKKQFNKQLYLAILKLPEKQAKRIYARFYLGMSMTDIAEAEGVSKMTVCESIKSGLANLKKLLNPDN